MTVNRFGGFWTRDKLNVLQEYLQFYCTAMSKQRYSLIYIDAFAGTGRCNIKSESGLRVRPYISQRDPTGP